MKTRFIISGLLADRRLCQRRSGPGNCLFPEPRTLSFPEYLSRIAEWRLTATDGCLQTLLISLLVNNLVKRKRAEEQTSQFRPPEHARLDLHRVATDAVQVVQADGASKGVGFHLGLEGDLPAVYGDNVQLQQVALYFLLNAVGSVSQSQSPQRLVTVNSVTLLPHEKGEFFNENGEG